MATLDPTPEQAAALDVFGSGLSMALDALAGTGKTSTLKMLAESVPGQRGQYVAFNKSIVKEAERKFPRNVSCQPDGTMVRVPELRRGTAHACGWREVPIEMLSNGDKVVSWNDRYGPVLRKRGRPIEVIRRAYDGPLVTVRTAGFASRYTPEHPCMVSVDDAFEGQWLVYMMGRRGYFKVGMCSWRLTSGRNGLAKRAQQEDADEFWILSAHDSREDALLCEALAQHEWRVPGWRFRDERKRDLDLPWSKIEPNRDAAEQCLVAFGRDISRPLWSRGESMKFGAQWLIVAACNVMDGMRVLAVDNSLTKGEFTKGTGPRRVWTPVTVSREWYTGTVTSLYVEDDHTYVADGILTHNCKTAHGLAFASQGRRFSRRLNSGRQRGDEMARILGVDHFVISYGSQRKVLQPGFLAGHVMKAVLRFCQSADDAPARHHLPYIDGIDLPDNDGNRTHANNDALAGQLEPHLATAWADLSDPDGKLRFSHDVYLKLFALAGTQVGCDFLLVDEAQDLSPVMLQIVENQQGAQVVLVGDANQSIYGWRGSINAMERSQVDARATLTHSFRFGPAIADVANWCLSHLPTQLRVEGHTAVASTVERLAEPGAVLTRTNAGAMEVLFDEVDRGHRVCLMGGGAEIASFARAARELQQHGGTHHPELACFSSWNEVKEYVADDPAGDELSLMVRLVDDYGPDAVLSALDGQTPEDGADVVISTAHKAKGREWDRVQLHSDFRDPADALGDSREEWRLLYVAATRAKLVLDPYPCPAFQRLLHPERGRPEPRPMILAPAAPKPAAYEGPVVTRGPIQVGQ